MDGWDEMGAVFDFSQDDKESLKQFEKNANNTRERIARTIMPKDPIHDVAKLLDVSVEAHGAPAVLAHVLEKTRIALYWTLEDWFLKQDETDAP